jgi:hypothetical protein
VTQIIDSNALETLLIWEGREVVALQPQEALVGSDPESVLGVFEETTPCGSLFSQQREVFFGVGRERLAIKPGESIFRTDPQKPFM